MSTVTGITWPQEYSELQRIDELLLCGICYDYLDTSVMTPCSHNYCSLCIRKYLHYKTQCPACFQKTFEKDLHTNRILDEIVSYFGKIKEKLVHCIAETKISTDKNDENYGDSKSSTPTRPARACRTLKKVSPKADIRSREILVHDRSEEYKATTTISERRNEVSSPSTSGTCKIAAIFTPKKKKPLAITPISGKTVPCPVCAVVVLECYINKHLDDCLKRENMTDESPRIEPKRKPLPKLVISLMNSTELRMKLKEFGLRCQGDRRTLEARFYRYSTLYNAECDKKEPRPIEELLKQCESEENLEKRLKLAQTTNKLQITGKCEQNIIEQAQKNYLKTNQRDFNDLIASIKEREKKCKPTMKKTLFDPEIEDRVVGSSECHDIAKRANDNPRIEDENNPESRAFDVYETTFHDSSDSNSTCPLQHYASDNPVNFLSFAIRTSESDDAPTKSPYKSDTVDRRRIENDESFCNEENDSSDEVVQPSPEVSTSHTKKRAKLSLRQKSQKINDPCEVGRNDNSEGRKLALSIARDFTFDVSSNDSVDTETLNDKDEKANVTKVDENEFVIEDHEIASRRPSIIARSRGKRNCVNHGQNITDAESVNANDKRVASTATNAIISSDLPSRIDVRTDEKSLTVAPVDDPLKRRRRCAKVATPNEANALNPPRRPLRKRLENTEYFRAGTCPTDPARE